MRSVRALCLTFLTSKTSQALLSSSTKRPRQKLGHFPNNRAGCTRTPGLSPANPAMGGGPYQALPQKLSARSWLLLVNPDRLGPSLKLQSFICVIRLFSDLDLSFSDEKAVWEGYVVIYSPRREQGVGAEQAMVLARRHQFSSMLALLSTQQSPTYPGEPNLPPPWAFHKATSLGLCVWEWEEPDGPEASPQKARAGVCSELQFPGWCSSDYRGQACALTKWRVQMTQFPHRYLGEQGWATL